MVEIKRVPTNVLAATSLSAHSSSATIGAGAGIEEDDRFRLLYSKSKVYVNPTAYARDNIPGFVALVKRVSCGSFPHEVARGTYNEY